MRARDVHVEVAEGRMFVVEVDCVCRFPSCLPLDAVPAEGVSNSTKVDVVLSGIFCCCAHGCMTEEVM